MTNKTGAGELIVVVVCGCGSDTPAIGDAGSDSSTPNDAGGDVNVNPGDGGRSLTEFPSTSTMYQGVSSAPIDSAWNAILGGALANEWGNAFQLDPALTVNYADARVARRSFTKSPSVLPDCDTAPVPVPAGAMTEGYPDYFCATPGDDCHLLAYQGTRLYEVYQGTSLADWRRAARSQARVWSLGI